MAQPPLDRAVDRAHRQAGTDRRCQEAGDELLTKTHVAQMPIADVGDRAFSLAQTRMHGVLLSRATSLRRWLPGRSGHAPMLRVHANAHIPQIAEGDYGFTKNEREEAAP